MTDQRVAAVEDNLLAFYAAAAEAAMFDTDGHDDVSTLHCDVAHPLFNPVFGARFAPGTEADRAQDVVARYAGRGRPFLWWLTPSTGSPELEQALTEAGLLREDVPGMQVALAGSTSPPVPEGIDLAVVTDQTRDSLIVTMLAGFGMPAELSVPMGALMGVLTGARVVHLLATADGVPVGTGSAYLTGETAGLYNIATVEASRGRGIGYAITAALMAHAHDRGCTEAVLHASEMGRPVYERLGFEEVCVVPQFAWLPPERC